MYLSLRAHSLIFPLCRLNVSPALPFAASSALYSVLCSNFTLPKKDTPHLPLRLHFRPAASLDRAQPYISIPLPDQKASHVQPHDRVSCLQGPSFPLFRIPPFFLLDVYRPLATPMCYTRRKKRDVQGQRGRGTRDAASFPAPSSLTYHENHFSPLTPLPLPALIKTKSPPTKGRSPFPPLRISIRTADSGRQQQQQQWRETNPIPIRNPVSNPYMHAKRTKTKACKVPKPTHAIEGGEKNICTGRLCVPPPQHTSNLFPDKEGDRNRESTTAAQRTSLALPSFTNSPKAHPSIITTSP